MMGPPGQTTRPWTAGRITLAHWRITPTSATPSTPPPLYYTGGGGGSAPEVHQGRNALCTPRPARPPALGHPPLPWGGSLSGGSIKTAPRRVTTTGGLERITLCITQNRGPNPGPECCLLCCVRVGVPLCGRYPHNYTIASPPPLSRPNRMIIQPDRRPLYYRNTPLRAGSRAPAPPFRIT